MPGTCGRISNTTAPASQALYLWAQRLAAPVEADEGIVTVLPSLIGPRSRRAPLRCPDGRTRASTRRRSYVAFAEQTPGPHDEHQDQQQVRDDRRGGRDFDRIEVVQRRSAGDRDPCL